MMAGMIRHVRSLGLMRRDHGWIHSLWSEAENERMHLLIALQLRDNIGKPVSFPIRYGVIFGQFAFLIYYTTAYILCPRYCHKFVGYLEEEAVITYTNLLHYIDEGKLPKWKNRIAPRFARAYYNLPPEATVRDLFACIRMDEACHRDTNHHMAGLASNEPNTMVEHLRKHHFQHQSGSSGLLFDQFLNKTDQAFDMFDIDKSNFIDADELKKALEHLGERPSSSLIEELMLKFDVDKDGKIDREEFKQMCKEM